MNKRGMIWRIELRNKPGLFEAQGEGIKKDILDLNIRGVKRVEIMPVYILSGELKKEEAELIAQKLLVDPVSQQYIINNSFVAGESKGLHIVEVAYHDGVMDPVEESTKKGLLDLGIKGIKAVKTAKRFIIEGQLTSGQLKYISEKLLYNKVIQHPLAGKTLNYEITTGPGYNFKLMTIDIVKADGRKLMAISKKGQLYLNLSEMQTIANYFKRLGRLPTDIELETLAQTWSEHCKHKTLRGLIEYKWLSDRGRWQTRLFDNLLKETIMEVTSKLNKDWCISVFRDNAGVISFDRDYNVCFKVETHNHPSALEPYGGAGTGLGGVIRDSLGTGRGAKPIANTDVFCFGPPDYPHKKLPAGTLHPKRIMKGVVAGVRDYGNRMGIPTVNGAVLFDEGYIGNPLVFCGNIGLMPRSKSFKKVSSGGLIVLVGGRTGRDGIHGATFSSAELTSASETISSSAVQIGNPIVEKKMAEALLKARDENLYRAVTDCGGGGLSSAVGEMGEETGVEVYLEKVPLKYAGLTYTEIWISESQERMILSVEPEKWGRLKEICDGENVEATIIGRFTADRRLRLLYQGRMAADLRMDFLHHGLPRLKRKAIWRKVKFKDPSFREPPDLKYDLLKILSSFNVCSKEWIIRQYDHEVQGGSVLKPLQGINSGPGDAAILRPRLDSPKGIIVSCGINFRYGFIDPYWMAASAIDEALRQIISVGGNLKEVAILDNFCWGNTDKPEELGSLVRASLACHDLALAYGLPFISGKDSLNNEYRSHHKSISIPGTLLISAVAIMPDVEKAISMDLKEEGNLLYLAGMTYGELGGSHYWMGHGHLGNRVPEVRPKEGKKIMAGLSQAMEKGLIRSCHDLSEGGLGVTAAEMAFSGGLGMELNLAHVRTGEKIRRNDELLFSESNTRFLVEVLREKQKLFEKAMKGLPFGLAGRVRGDSLLRIIGLKGNLVLEVSLAKLKEAWQKPLANI